MSAPVAGMCYYVSNIENSVILGESTQYQGATGTNLSYTFTTPDNCRFIRFSYPSDCATVQLELGSSATVYEPYHDGGTAQAPAPLFAVDTAADEHEAVSGVTTHKMAKSKISDLTWARYQHASSFYYFRCQSAPTVTSAKIIADRYVKVKTGTPNLTDKTITGYTGMPLILVRDDAFETVEAWLAAVGDSYVYYELATPTTSTSTPTQITFQAGNNVAMQTDGGRTLAELALTYENLPSEE